MPTNPPRKPDQSKQILQRPRSIHLSPQNPARCLHSQQLNLDEASINFNGDTIKASKQAKFLGMTLDSRLSWNNHLDCLIKRCTMHNTNIISSLRSTWWGAHPQSLLPLYKSLILGTIDYRLPCILPQNRTFFYKLGVVQRRAIRLVLGLRNSTPNRVVCADAHEHPLHIRQSKLANRYVLKIFSITNHPATNEIGYLENSITARKSQELAKYPLVLAYNRFSIHRPKIHLCPTPLYFFYSLKSQQFTPNLITDQGKKINKAESPHHAFLSRFKKLLSTHTAFYTDGSGADPGSYVGLAIYSSPPENFKFLARISSLASIFSVEALAIQLTLEYIASLNLSKAVIFTDSLSTIQALDNYSTFIPSTHATIFRIKNLLLELNDQGKSIFLAWIRSHKGIHGNEEVDTLAK